MLEALITLLVILSTPAILEDFNASIGKSSFLLTAFYLPFVVLMPVWSRLGDVIGRKRAFLLGLVIFILGCLVSFTAASLTWFIAGRAVQGAGSSAHEPLSISFIGDSISPERQGKAMGIRGTAGSIAVIAILFGGLIVDAWGWRVIFLAALALGVLAFILAGALLPGYPTSGKVRDVDWQGAVSLIIGMTALILAISNVNAWGWTSFAFIGLVIVGVIGLLGTGIKSRPGKQPFLDFKLFSTPVFWFSSIAAAAAVFTLTGATLNLPLYLRDVEALGSSWIGAALFASGVGLFAGSLLGGAVTDRWGVRRHGILGLALLSVSVFAMAILTQSGFPVIVISFAVASLAAGLCFAPFTTAVTTTTLPEGLGAASGAHNLIRRTGTVLGAAMSGAILELRLATLSASSIPSSTTLIASHRDTFLFLGIISLLALIPAARVPSRSRA